MSNQQLLSEITAVLKTLNKPGEIPKLMYPQNPFLAVVPKDEDYAGDSLKVPLQFAPTAGVSPVFGDAQAAKAGTSNAAFTVTTNDLYSLFSINRKSAMATRNDEGAFVKLIKHETDGAKKAFGMVLGKALFGNGGGSLGRVASGGGTTSIVLTEYSDVVNFYRNMQVQGSTTDGTSGAVIANISTLTAVDRDDPASLTAGAAFDATAFANGNHIFLRGAFGQYVDGLSAWVPAAAPSATLFNGVDRTDDTVMLGGVRYDAVASEDINLEQYLMHLSARIGLHGGTPDLCIMHPLTVNLLLRQLSNKVEYDRMAASGTKGSIPEIGFKTLKLIVETGELDVLSDRNCPRDRVYMLTKNTLRLTSMGPLMGFLHYGDDDSDFMRHASEDAMEGRTGGYMQLYCDAPGWNGTGDISELL